MPKPTKAINLPRRESRVYLEAWLARRKMTAEQLAARMETSKSVVSKLINGKQRYNQDWLERIAFVLDCDVADLYRLPFDPTANELLEKMTPTNREMAINLLIDLAGERKPGS